LTSVVPGGVRYSLSGEYNGMPTKTSFAAFCAAIWADWWTCMSGPLSVPLAIAGAVGLSFSEQTNSKILYGLLLLTGIVTGVQAAFFVWRRPQERVIELEEQTRPKLTLEFNTAIHGCVRPTAIKVRRRRPEMTSSEPAMRMWSTAQAEVRTSTSTVLAAAPQLASTIYGDREVRVPCVYYRIKIDTDTVPAIEECHGYLVSVDYLNGTERKTVLAGDNLDLTFASAEDPDTRSKRVSAGISQYLDFLAITTTTEFWLRHISSKQQFRLTLTNCLSDTAIID
jgi:hypothetical protein